MTILDWRRCKNAMVEQFTTDKKINGLNDWRKVALFCNPFENRQAAAII
jgi:hypothetical protein